MLYYLFRFLGEYGIPGSHMWTYISFRALLTLMLSLVISVWFGEYFIRWMRRHNVSEAQRDKSIDPYGVEKKGVPTMGGVIIIVSIIVPCLLFGRLRNIYMILMLATTVWLGLLGFADDYIKMKVSKDGLRPIYKLAGQTLLGLIVGLTLWLSPDAVIRENVTMQRMGNTEVVVHKSEKVKSTITTIPFVKDNNLDYAEIMSFCGKYKTAAGWFLFVVMTTLVVVAVSNGSNLNDGMDGMTAGNSAIIIHKELLIPLMCFVFLMESLSVILQVNYAKWGNRKGLKLRVFKRAPIHDAFRVRPGQLAPDVKVLCKWPKGCWLESKITVRFWIITIILAAMTIITLKIR